MLALVKNSVVGSSLPYTFINPIEDQWVIDGMGGIFEGVCEGSQAVSKERKKALSQNGWVVCYSSEGTPSWSVIWKRFLSRP